VTLRWSVRAKTHLLAIQEYLQNREGAAAAARVGAVVREAAEIIRTFPHAGRAGRVPGTREWVVRQLPYVIVYEVGAERRSEVTILGVFHGRQSRQ